MKTNNIAAVILWGFYGLIVGCCLFLTSMSITAELEYGAVAGLVAGAVVLAALGLAVCGLKFAAQRMLPKRRIPKDSENSGILPAAIENILVIACLACMIGLRLMQSWDMASDPFFEMAEISTKEFAPVIAHRGMELYIYLLHGTLFILGNKAFAALFLQILLSFCAALSLYFGIRRMSGFVAALTVTVFFCFTPYMSAETGRLSPLFLFLIFYGLAIRCIAAIGSKDGEKDRGKVFRIVNYIASGLFIGLCCYLDMAGVSLLILLTAVICFGGENAADAEDNKIAVFFICLLAVIAGYVGVHGLRSLGGGSIGDSIGAQIEIYQSGDFAIPVSMGERGVFWDVILMVILMSVGIFSFWHVHRIKDKAIWLFAALLIMGMQCFGMNCSTYFNAYAVLYLLCAAMAGCSLSDLTVLSAKPEQNAEVNDDMGIIDMDEQNNETGGETSVIKTDGAETDATPVINYIENPLPLPKKRVHRMLDYDYEVADDDDFDIQ